MGSISVIVVSWNARELLRQCLASIRDVGAGRVLEVIVVDNASADGSPDMVEREFPEATLIRSDRNLGFARANNLAMRQANGTLFALVNSDVVVHSGCFDILAAFVERNPCVGLAGPRIVGRDGKVQGTCRRIPSVWNNLCRSFALDRLLPRWPWFSGHEMRHFRHDVHVDAEVLSGCFWLARKAAVEEVGGLDERFFFYMEDVDWCRRFWDRGWRVSFVPDATAVHYGGGSTSNAPLHYSIQYHRANLKYWHKYHGIAGWCTYASIAGLHHGLRLMARVGKKTLGLGTSAESKHKLLEDMVCLRWLFTGKGV